ncbi:hypothetical protein [Paraburkholderia sp. JHI869]|uniref:hypothetical protein n=1 Tax=Paraburkholderia sp. JHI869 TaxID=3112959 RepID=UPI00316F7D83
MKNGMSRWKRVVLGLILLLGAASAKAEAPAHCSYGYQDSSCLGPQYRAAQTPPTCSTGAGWTTLTPAKWIGSGFTQAVCHYDAPPTCGAGTTQTGDPGWNGSSWSAPMCTPIFTQPTVPQMQAMCAAALPGGYSLDPGYGYQYTVVQVQYIAGQGGWVVYQPPLTTWSEFGVMPLGSSSMVATDTSFWLQLIGPSYTATQNVCGEQGNPYTAYGYNGVCQVNQNTGHLDVFATYPNYGPMPANSNPNCGAG